MEKLWNEHGKPTEETEPSRLLSSTISHLFTRKVLMPAQEDEQAPKKLETFSLLLQNQRWMNK